MPHTTKDKQKSPTNKKFKNMDGQWSWSTSKKKFRRITNYNLDCSHYNDVLDIQKQLQTMKTDLSGINTSGGPEALISLISSKKTWVDQQIR